MDTLIRDYYRDPFPHSLLSTRQTLKHRQSAIQQRRHLLGRGQSKEVVAKARGRKYR